MNTPDSKPQTSFTDLLKSTKYVSEAKNTDNTNIGGKSLSQSSQKPLSSFTVAKNNPNSSNSNKTSKDKNNTSSTNLSATFSFPSSSSSSSSSSNTASKPSHKESVVIDKTAASTFSFAGKTKGTTPLGNALPLSIRDTLKQQKESLNQKQQNKPTIRMVGESDIRLKKEIEDVSTIDEDRDDTDDASNLLNVINNGGVLHTVAIDGQIADLRDKILKNVNNTLTAEELTSDIEYDSSMTVKMTGVGQVTIAYDKPTEGEAAFLKKQEHIKRKTVRYQKTHQTTPFEAPKFKKPTKEYPELVDTATVDDHELDELKHQIDLREERERVERMQEHHSKEKRTVSMSIDDLKSSTSSVLKQKSSIVVQEQKFKYVLFKNGKRVRRLVKAEESMSQANKNKNNIRSTRTIVKEVVVPEEGLLLRELASKVSMKIADVKSRLEALGERSVSAEDEAVHVIDADTAELFVLELGITCKRLESSDKSHNSHASKDGKRRPDTVDKDQTLVMVPRAPVVCILGHVDHGKTTLLDYLRKENVAASEAGGITQKLSAFTVELAADKRVVFLDTPGHAAFSAMRVNGASATDVAVLVVAADDGLRPQTIEAIQAARDGDCTIVVALNKIDKIPEEERNAVRMRILSQLVEQNVLAEEFGGDVMVVEISGKTGEGVDSLIETLALQTEVLELQAAATGFAEATILDASMEKGRGVVITTIVRWGQLSVGDSIVAGSAYGKVKALELDNGVSVKSVGPSTPVRITGLKTVPLAGQEVITVPSEARAKDLAERRTRVLELRKAVQQPIQQSSSPSLPSSLSSNESSFTSAYQETGSIADNSKLVNMYVLLKADGPGTVNALEKVMNNVIARLPDFVKVTVASASIGEMKRSDLESLQSVSNVKTCALCFNVNFADSNTRTYAKASNIPIFRNTIIYRLEEDFIEYLQSLLPTEHVLTKIGSAVVKQVFTVTGKTPSTVAGLSVESGLLKLSNVNNKFVFKLTRAGKVIFENVEPLALKKFKENVFEVELGNECGLNVDKHTDYAPGDVVECFRVDSRQRKIFPTENELQQAEDQPKSSQQQQQQQKQGKSGHNSKK